MFAIISPNALLSHSKCRQVSMAKNYSESMSFKISTLFEE